MKPVIYYTREYNSLNAPYFEHFISQWLDLRPYSPDVDLSDAFLMVGLPHQETIKSVGISNIESCRGILVDNLQEGAYYGLETLEPYAKKTLVMSSGVYLKHDPWTNFLNIPEWFWYFESPWYHSKNYHLYQPNIGVKEKLFFMPIRLSKPGREMIFEATRDILDNAIWSFVSKGVRLPGYPEDQLEDQRWFNPEWYDKTFFSVVNEDSNMSEPLIMTEKTCKPLAFFHPFIVVAQPGLLSLIRKYGFLTWPELFDESYDDIIDLNDKISAINKQIRSFDKDIFYSREVQEKLQHNHDHFFDQTLVFHNIQHKLINSILEFVETTR